MAGTQQQRAYRRADATQPASRSSFTVIRGGRASDEPALESWKVAAFRLAIVVVVLVACACIARVALVSSTMAALDEAQTVTAQVQAGYAEGSSLEVQRSTLASPTRIQSVASEQLGMAPAESISYLDLIADDAQEVGAVSDTRCSLAAAVSQVAAAASADSQAAGSSAASSSR